METYIIDRFEGETAVLEGTGGGMRDIPRGELPPDARPGDVLRYENGAFRIDARATGERRADIEQRMRDLFD